MRTRLDEIVEEECNRFNAVEVGKRIAERAFRHGVDQVPTVWGTRYVNVQPAPASAEEKCGCVFDPNGVVAHWYCRHHTERRKAAETPTRAERRVQGERRGGPLKRWSGELHGMTMFYGRGTEDFLYVVDYSGGYYRCRRSGLDRRKG